ncbi:MAG TPA: DNA-binding domain-containing protein [Tepidisphaeraceae bacterium]|nr:DNA-binding domain-containing protein [Tepidisphaeraceae bacterium]
MPFSARESSPSTRLAASKKRLQTFGELRELQRLSFSAVSYPLSAASRMQKTWKDGRPMGQVISEFIKPNDRLTSFERLEIYNRQYWFRLLDCLWDDYPGLRAILGNGKFEKLRIAYLRQYPSRSFTLRNLGSRLVEFLEHEPRYTAPRQKMCLDMARFEWAQVVAFDGETKPPLGVDDLLAKEPAKLRLGLQPYLSLLELNYPLDDFVIAVKKQDSAMRSEASNAMEEQEKEARPRKVRLPRARKTFLAVHRFDNQLYYKRLDPPAFRILCALRDGASLADACQAAVGEDDAPPEEIAGRIRQWFSSWTQIGWFCAPPSAGRAGPQIQRESNHGDTGARRRARSDVPLCRKATK